MQFFDRWYDGSDRARKPFKATRPDVELRAAPGTSAADASGLSEKARDMALGQVRTMAEAAAKDWPAFLGEGGRLDLHWIDAFDSYWDRARISALIERSDPGDFSNPYLVTCCEFGAALGEALLAGSARCEWLAGWPYWESAVYHPPSGSRVNVFHWAVKKFSEYGVDDGFAAKVTACLARLENERRTPAKRGSHRRR